MTGSREPWELPVEPGALGELRRAAEQSGDALALAELRDLERAARELPQVIDGVRRRRLLAWDPLATTWEGWATRTGERVLLRCLRPRFRDDPVVRRHLAQPLPTDVPGLIAGQPHLDGTWPHRRATVPGLPLAELLPEEDPAEETELAWLLGRGLGWLAALHGQGSGVDGAWGSLVTLGPEGPTFAWLGRPVANPQADRDDLLAVVAWLDPDTRTTPARLARAWSEEPPPSAEDAAQLLQRALTTQLLAARHRLARQARGAARRTHAARLRQMVQRLTLALPPPPLYACLHAGRDGLLTLVRCDGRVLQGGTAAEVEGAALHVVLTHGGRLDARPARRLLRAWATRRGGDEALRNEVNARLGATDEEIAQLTRWLASRARLRAARMLIDQETTGVTRLSRLQ